MTVTLVLDDLLAVAVADDEAALLAVEVAEDEIDILFVAVALAVDVAV